VALQVVLIVSLLSSMVVMQGRPNHRRELIGAGKWRDAELMSTMGERLRPISGRRADWRPPQQRRKHEMTRYLLAVDFQPGAIDTPMEEWKPEEIKAHLDYYRALHRELVASGELVASEVLSGPDVAKIVTSDGTAPVVTDGPFQEFKEWLAGYQIVDVESEERAIEIAAKVSAVPGPGGLPLQQPIQVRQVMDDAPADAEAMTEYLQTAEGVR
jgi:hypothetical protein